MDIERAIEIVKWGRHYVKPMPTAAEHQEALRLVEANPDRWDEILWGDKTR